MPFIRANSKRIHYSDSLPTSGSSPRETFVFIHGLGSSQNYYGGVIPLLTAENYRCVALDTTGSGRSPYTYIEQSIQSLSSDVVAVMDALSIEKAVVVGHSMGGITAPNLAAEYPNRVSAIVLCGPVYPSEAAASTFEARIVKVEEEGMEAMANMIPYAAVGSRAKSLHSAFIRELLLGQEVPGYVSLCRVIAGAWKDGMPAYGRVECPMLIVAGQEDKSAPLEGCKRILEEVGTRREEKRLEVLEGVGHWMCVEAPAEVGGLVVGFLKDVQ